MRDVRTPLAVGYVWLLVAWLLFSDRVPRFRPVEGGLVSALFDLGSVVGKGALLAAVSFVAYLIGALLSHCPWRVGLPPVSWMPFDPACRKPGSPVTSTRTSCPGCGDR